MLRSKTLFLAAATLALAWQASAQDVPVVEHELTDAYRYVASGGLTASGEPYNPDRLTMAHPSLPFGTLVEVTFRQRMVVARVNDRRDRVMLSASAADRLGLPPGGGAVELQLDPEEFAFMQEQARRRAALQRNREQAPSPVAQASSGRFTVQLASFSSEARAQEHAGRTRGTWIQAVEADGRTVYRVYYGVYPSRESAGRALQALIDDGHSGFVKELHGANTSSGPISEAGASRDGSAVASRAAAPGGAPGDRGAARGW